MDILHIDKISPNAIRTQKKLKLSPYVPNTMRNHKKPGIHSRLETPEICNGEICNSQGIPVLFRKKNKNYKYLKNDIFGVVFGFIVWTIYIYMQIYMQTIYICK